MRIVLLVNPIAGAGRAARVGREFESALRAAGHDVMTAETRSGAGDAWIDELLSEAELLVVIGGDGAVLGACGAASRTGIPVYQVPCGTENLFAREFGMERDRRKLLAALERWNVQSVDVGVANGQPFLLMASLGFDAAVVHDLAFCRNGAISPAAYLGPIWRQLRAWRPPHVQVRVDGEAMAAGEGCVVVANSRQYGWRLDPARRARMDDGLLDAVFLPVRSSAAVLAWMVRCRLGTHLASGRATYRTGRHIEIVSEPAHHFQLDGDPPACHPGAAAPSPTKRLLTSAEARKLRVLIP